MHEHAPAGPAAPPSEGEPSIAQLLGNLISDAQTLVRREIDLAKTEITGEINKVRQGTIMLGIGAGVAAIGGMLLILMIAELLIAFADTPRWLAYLIVGGLLAIIGGAVLFVGIKRFQQLHPIPNETIDSVRKDVSWLKEQSRSDRT